MEPLLEVKNLKTSFKIGKKWVPAVEQVSFHVDPGETLGIVGESGCGKSVTSMSVMRLLPKATTKIEADEILLNGKNIAAYSDKEMAQVRGKGIGMIFQDSMTSLNPVKTIGKQLDEAFIVHHSCDKNEAKIRSIEMLTKVGIPSPEKRYGEYPHQLSGGMRQRVMIAMALAQNPSLIIADEPTTALDVTIQAQVLELIQEMSRQTGAAVIMITHDLGVVASLCDRINIMYGGRLAETGTDREIFYEPNHPYTKGLLNCINNPEDDDKELTPIPGSPPDLLKPPAGCPFVDRCSEAMKICKTKMPVETIFSDTHRSACWLNENKNREEAQHGNTK